ncbi:hypothetical protein IID19_03765 [Patescibacteria group bacterium]|nr:hypothetical protein [Patescibacteria group bacterium]
MNQDDNTTDDFSGGFLIKDVRGRFKKVQGDKIVDIEEQTSSTVDPSVETKEILETVVKKQEVDVSTQPIPAPSPPTPETPPRKIPVPKPLPPISSSEKAISLMEPDDEKEIAKQVSKLKNLVAQPGLDLPVAISTAIEKIIHQNNLRFDDEVMLKRFSKVLESRLRSIRNSIETKEVLSRQKKIGGLAMTEEVAQKVISSVEEEAESLYRTGLTKDQIDKAKEKKDEARRTVADGTDQKITPMFVEAPPAFVPRPGGAVHNKEQSVVSKPAVKNNEENTEILAESIKQEIKEVSQKREDAVPQEMPKSIPPAMPATKPSVIEDDHELYGKPDEEMPRITPVRQIDKQRPHMADIKQPIQVVGPVDELGQTDIKEFRRLGTNPQDAAEKIVEKIDLLEEESWPMRMDGIAAWKKSPLNKLYVSIGRQSMDSSKIIQEVINQLSQSGQPHLLMEEFLAINEINHKLSV